MKKRIVSLVLAFSILLSMLPMSALTALAQDSILYGDADGNGKVDMSDVNLMEQYIDGDAETINSIHLADADVNADNVVNSDDVALVKEYLAGNIQLTDDLCTVSFDTGGGGDRPDQGRQKLCHYAGDSLPRQGGRDLCRLAKGRRHCLLPDRTR
mgnify:CR=1 FL=1